MAIVVAEKPKPETRGIQVQIGSFGRIFKRVGPNGDFDDDFLEDVAHYICSEPNFDAIVQSLERISESSLDSVSVSDLKNFVSADTFNANKQILTNSLIYQGSQIAEHPKSYNYSSNTQNVQVLLAAFSSMRQITSALSEVEADKFTQRGITKRLIESSYELDALVQDYSTITTRAQDYFQQKEQLTHAKNGLYCRITGLDDLLEKRNIGGYAETVLGLFRSWHVHQSKVEEFTSYNPFEDSLLSRKPEQLSRDYKTVRSSLVAAISRLSEEHTTTSARLVRGIEGLQGRLVDAYESICSYIDEEMHELLNPSVKISSKDKLNDAITNADSILYVIQLMEESQTYVPENERYEFDKKGDIVTYLSYLKKLKGDVNEKKRIVDEKDRQLMESLTLANKRLENNAPDDKIKSAVNQTNELYESLKDKVIYTPIESHPNISSSFELWSPKLNSMEDAISSMNHKFRRLLNR